MNDLIRFARILSGAALAEGKEALDSAKDNDLPPYAAAVLIGLSSALTNAADHLEAEQAELADRLDRRS